MADAARQGLNLEPAGTHNAEPRIHEERGLTPQQDPLAAAFYSLFINVATVVQSQLQCNTESLELLERMNLRTADEYNEYGDFAAGLRVFVERLKLKNDSFQQYTWKIDQIEREVSELESIVSVLNTRTGALEAKLRKAYAEGHLS